MVACVGALAVRGRRHLGALVLAVPAAGAAVQLPHAIVVYQADTLEIPRHAVLVAVMRTRLSLLVLGCRSGDRRDPRPEIGLIWQMYD